jgi:hypothetical protein
VIARLCFFTFQSWLFGFFAFANKFSMDSAPPSPPTGLFPAVEIFDFPLIESPKMDRDLLEREVAAIRKSWKWAIKSGKDIPAARLQVQLEFPVACREAPSAWSGLLNSLCERTRSNEQQNSRRANKAVKAKVAPPPAAPRHSGAVIKQVPRIEIRDPTSGNSAAASDSASTQPSTGRRRKRSPGIPIPEPEVNSHGVMNYAKCLACGLTSHDYYVHHCGAPQCRECFETWDNEHGTCRSCGVSLKFPVSHGKPE